MPLWAYIIDNEVYKIRQIKKHTISDQRHRCA
nr:MAG TPA: hypothetical protein [Caudoviricetes sp.]